MLNARHDQTRSKRCCGNAIPCASRQIPSLFTSNIKTQTMMKQIKLFTPLLWLALALSSLIACVSDDYNDWITRQPRAIVTVCPKADGSYFMQLDDSTTLVPKGNPRAPYGNKEVRALVNYNEASGGRRGGQHTVEVLWMDSIRTKWPVPSKGAENDRVFGNDEIEIVKDWTTVAEDGYLTLRLRTQFGNPQIIHKVNLLTGVNPNDPYEMELRHDACGDVMGPMADALVAFNLNALPRPKQGNKVQLKLRWKSFHGERVTNIKLSFRKS